MKTIMLLGIIAILAITSLDAESLFVVINNDNVTILDNDINTNCASKFFVTTTVSGNPLAFTIVVTECDTIGPIADCFCDLDVSVMLKALKSGQYTVLLYRQFQKKHFYATDTTIFVGSVSFALHGTMGVGVTSSFKQSGCKLPETHNQTFTAQYWRSEADSVAQSVCEDAKLLDVASKNVLPDGKSSQWKYRFSRYNLLDNRPEYLYFHNDDNGIIFDSISAFTVCCIKNISKEWLDSDSAIAYAESQGGEAFRKNNPSYLVSASLYEALVPDSYPCWEIIYCSPNDSTNKFSISFDARSKKDSLVDVFPLGVGNEWTYGYQWSSYDYVSNHNDTGIVTATIIGEEIAADSTTWSVQQRGLLWHWDEPGGNSATPISSTDTIKLAELQQGRHQLFVADDQNTITRSLFPFFRNRDSLVYRFTAVDTEGVMQYTSNMMLRPGILRLTFQRNVGLSTVFISDGCTCMTGYTGNYLLRSYTVTDVA
ncbi:MAG: hypothetical protein KGJ59_09605, partial [Bacteroidota bacterium]|nr:hypothetical protein [Bacteroidota bacterium]